MIDAWNKIVFGDHNVGASLDTSFADTEVAGIGVCCKDHDAGLVGDPVVGVCGDVVEQLIDGGGLLGSDFTEVDEEFVVDGSRIEEEDADDALDSFDAGIVQGWT